MRIPEIIQNKLIDRHDLPIDIHRIALWPEDVEQFNLPFNPKATKTKDPNHGWYQSKGYGDYSVELDALHPEVLIEKITSALEDHLDIEDMIAQQDIQKAERQKLKQLKLGFQDLCHSQQLSI
jgi:hypothetical protein